MFPIIVTIPQYIKEVKISNSQRARYWTWNGTDIKAKNKRLLKRYIDERYNTDIILNDGKVHFRQLKEPYAIGIIINNKIKGILGTDIVSMEQAKKAKLYLIRKDTGEIILDNADKVGQPKFIKIKGQDIYSGNMPEFTRATVMAAIKEQFKPFVEPIPVITRYPIKITMELYTTIKNINDRSNTTKEGQRWDVDNHAFPYTKAFPDVLTELGKIIDDDRLHVTTPTHAVFCPCKREEDRKLVFIIERDERFTLINNKLVSNTNPENFNIIENIN